MSAKKTLLLVGWFVLVYVSPSYAQQDLHAGHDMGQMLEHQRTEDQPVEDVQAELDVEQSHTGHSMGVAEDEDLAADMPIDDLHADSQEQPQEQTHLQHDMGGPQSGHSEHNMVLDGDGMVMNSNLQMLPRDCVDIAGEYAFEVYAGTEFASDYPGTVYGMSQHEYLVKPCSRITITFINTDAVRHQWMIHGLPRYLYPGGMFHLEAAGGQTRTGTFIIPSDDKTYLVHCDMAQHMEMGMKAQLKAGKGSGDLWSIPGVSRSFRPDSYLPNASRKYVLLALFAGVMLVGLIPYVWRRWR